MPTKKGVKKPPEELTEKQKIFCREYAITNLGRIYSLPRKNKRGQQIGGIFIKQQISNKGYSTVNLTVNGCTRRYNVHRLVASEFIENPFKLPEVNHKNGIKTDNRVENLEWTDRISNINHYWKGAGRNKPRTRRQQITVLLLNYSKRVLDSNLAAEIDRLKGTMSQAMIAKRLDVSPQTIMRYLKGNYAV